MDLRSRLLLGLVAAPGCWLSHGSERPPAPDAAEPPEPDAPPENDPRDPIVPPRWLRLTRTEKIDDVVQAGDTRWIATSSGLVAQERSGAMRWLTPENAGLSSLAVHALSVGTDGTLWVGTDAGLGTWRDDEGWTDRGGGFGDGVPQRIERLAIDGAGRVMTANGEQLARYDGAWEAIDREALGIPRGTVADLTASADGDVWAAIAAVPEDVFTDAPQLVGGGLVRFEGDTAIVLDALPSSQVAAVAGDAAGTIYALLNDPAVLVAVEGDVVREIPVPDGLEYVDALAVGADGTVAIGAHPGDVWVRRDDRWIALGMPDPTLGARVRLVDDEGLVWASGPDLWVHDGTGWTEHPTSSSDLPTMRLRDVAVTADDRVWLATDDRGLLVFDGEAFEAVDVSTNAVQAVEVDAEDRVWFVTSDGQLFWHEGGDWTGRPLPFEGLPGSFAFTMTVGCPGVVWIGAVGGSNGGLARFADDSFELFGVDDLPHHSVRAVDCDPVEGLWIGTYGNVSHREGEGWITTRHDEPGAPGDYVHALRIDRAQGGVWAAHASAGGGGLSVRRGGAWEAVDLTAFGGPGTTGGALAEDRDGRIVLMAGGVLARIDPATTAAEALEPASADYWVGAIAADGRGNLVLASQRGLAFYNPDGVVGLDRYLGWGDAR